MFLTPNDYLARSHFNYTQDQVIMVTHCACAFLYRWEGFLPLRQATTAAMRTRMQKTVIRQKPMLELA